MHERTYSEWLSDLQRFRSGPFGLMLTLGVLLAITIPPVLGLMLLREGQVPVFLLFVAGSGLAGVLFLTLAPLAYRWDERRRARTSSKASPRSPRFLMTHADPAQEAVPLSQSDIQLLFAASDKGPEAVGDVLEAFLRRQKGPERPFIYALAHRVLRDEAFENHPELIRALAGNSSIPDWPLWHAVARTGILLSPPMPRAAEETSLPDDDELDAELAAEQEFFDTISIHPRRRNGFTAHVITMPPPEFAPEAYLVSIVFKDDEPHDYMQPSPSTRYFTLEKALGEQPPKLCEWHRDGTRSNYGACPSADIDGFADAVFDRIFTNQ